MKLVQVGHKCLAELPLFFLLLAVISIISQNQASVCPTNPRYEFYPSINGTSLFVQCLNNGTTILNYTCPDSLAFKPRTSLNDTSPLCVPSNSQYGNAVFECNNSSGNGSYSGDPSLYVTCQNGTPTDLYECPTGEYFLETLSQCNMTCAVQYKIGSYATTDGYYTCLFDYGTLRWNLTVYTCPANTAFNEEYQFCLPSNTPV